TVAVCVPLAEPLAKVTIGEDGRVKSTPLPAPDRSTLTADQIGRASWRARVEIGRVAATLEEAPHSVAELVCELKVMAAEALSVAVRVLLPDVVTWLVGSLKLVKPSENVSVPSTIVSFTAATVAVCVPFEDPLAKVTIGDAGRVKSTPLPAPDRSTLTAD